VEDAMTPFLNMTASAIYSFATDSFIARTAGWGCPCCWFGLWAGTHLSA